MATTNEQIFERLGTLTESVGGMSAKLESVAAMAEEASHGVIELKTEVANLSARVNRMNPLWTFIFDATRGYGDLVRSSKLTRGATLVFWSAILGMAVLGIFNKAGVDTSRAINDLSTLQGIVHDGASDYMAPITGGE